MTVESRRASIEAWWALVARVLAFLLGLVLISILVVNDSEIIFAYLAALALTGPVVTASMVQMLRAARGQNGGSE